MRLSPAIDRAVKSRDHRRIKRVTHRIIHMTRSVPQTEPITATVRNRSLRIVTKAMRTGV